MAKKTQQKPKLLFGAELVERVKKRTAELNQVGVSKVTGHMMANTFMSKTGYQIESGYFTNLKSRNATVGEKIKQSLADFLEIDASQIATIDLLDKNPRRKQVTSGTSNFVDQRLASLFMRSLPTNLHRACRQ